MSREVPFASPGADPLRCNIQFPLVATLYPLGCPVRLSTNSPHVIAAAREGWGDWQQQFDFAPVDVQLGVAPGVTALPDCAPLPSAREHLLVAIHAPSDFVIADVRTGLIFGWISEAVAANSGYLRYHFLDALVLSTLISLYFAPIHSSCVAHNGRGILLCGESGAGKTSLAYALSRRGWTYVSDDASHLVRNSSGTNVVGGPFRIRFRAAAAALFPELAAFQPVQRPNGNLDLEIPTAALGLKATTASAEIRAVVILNRDPSATASIRGLSSDTLLRELHQVLTWGPLHTRAEQAAAFERLAALPTYLLTYSEFDRADELLRDLANTH